MIEFWIILALTILWLRSSAEWARWELESDEWRLKWLNCNINANVKRKKHPRKFGRKTK
jgi:hypothetical protein